MKWTVTIVLAAQTILFYAASLLHRGGLIAGHEHARAATAESAISVVLLLGLLVFLIRPGSATAIAGALVVQGLALIATLVGLFTMAVGVGPRTTPDLVVHACMIVLLLAGLWVTWRAGVI